MKITVCIKQVPENESATSPGPENLWVIRDEKAGYRINRLDEFAMEEALKIKDLDRKHCIHAITAGPGRSADVLIRAFGMGADQGTHIIAPEANTLNAENCAQMIAGELRLTSPDLVICGIMSEDLMQGQTGPMIAEILGVNCVTSVTSIEVSPCCGFLDIEREVSGGKRQRFTVRLPALLTVQGGINTPRYPSLSNVLKARKKEIRKVTKLPATFPGENIRTRLTKKTRDSVIISGNREEKAKELIRILTSKGVLRHGQK